MSTGNIDPNRNALSGPLSPDPDAATPPLSAGSSSDADEADAQRFRSLMGGPDSHREAHSGGTNPGAITAREHDRHEGERDDERGDDRHSALGAENRHDGKEDRASGDHAKDGGKGDDKGGPADALPDGAEMIAAWGASILQGMGMASSGAAAAIDEAAPVSATQTISEVGGEVADKILVSDPELNAHQQVTLIIKDDVLPATQVDIWKSPEGELNVRFITASPEASGVLAQSQQELQQMLRDRLKLDQVSVTVQYDKPGAPTGGSGGENEGRSRQQRDLYEEMEK